MLMPSRETTLRQFLVQGHMLANEQIGLSVVRFQPDWQAAGDTFLCAIGVIFAGCLVIDVTGEIDNFAADLLCFSGREFFFAARVVRHDRRQAENEESNGCEIMFHFVSHFILPATASGSLRKWASIDPRMGSKSVRPVAPNLSAPSDN
jgi:hypothetical protein